MRRAGYRRVCGVERVPTFLLHRQAGTARRNDGLTACRPGGRFQRFTPRGLLRWRGTRGALRVLFFLGVSPPAKKSTQKRSQALLFFERSSVQVHKICHKEAGTAAFLSASQTPKGKKSRPKERSWLPQARGKRCTGASCVRRTGAAPRAPQSGAQGAAGSEAFEV